MTKTSRLIILVPGWGSPSGQEFILLDKRFRNEGFDVIRATIPRFGIEKFQDSAKKIKDLVATVRSHYDHITLVGYSAGGLIGRYAVAANSDHGIDAFVSIGTPHEGTYSAQLGIWFSKSAAQMCRGSDFIRRLNDKGWDSSVPALSIQGSLEEIVIPQSSARITFGENITIPGATHVSLILHARTFWEIYSWLTFKVFNETPRYQDEGYSSRVTLI